MNKDLAAKQAIDALTGKTIDITLDNLGGLSINQCIEKLKEIKKDLVDRFDMNPNKYFFNFSREVRQSDSLRERAYIRFYRQDLFERKYFCSEMDDFKSLREKK